MHDTSPLETGRLRASGFNRSGVALVIVLGLLALLMITGVSFTILMRIERSGASNLRHTSAARQMAKGGIAYAIAALNHNIGTNQYPDWPDRAFRNAEGRTSQERDGRVVGSLRLPEDIFLSVVENEDEPLKVASARVMSVEAAQYLPAALRHRAEMNSQNDVDYAAPEWIPVMARNTIVGRYAYVVLNTTGLLDANLVQSTLTNRWMGGSPTEMRLDPDVQFDVVNAASFAAQRKTHGRYETLPELSRKNTGLDGAALANFDVFSYSVPDLIPKRAAIADMQAAHDLLRNQTQGRRIDIGTEAKIKSQQARIVDAFKLSGLNDTQARWAYLGLVDYVDTDDQPEGTTDAEKFARPATEAMPLFSAFALAATYAAQEFVKNDEPWYRHTVTYDIRVIYTFPFRSRRKSYKLDAEIYFVNPGGTEAKWEPLITPTDTFRISQTVDVGPGETPYLETQQTLTLELPKSQNKPAFLRYVVGCRATTSSGGVVIRQTPALYDQLDSMVQLNIGMNQNDIDNGAIFWSEALDPRCNWENIYALWRANRDYAWEENPGAGGNPDEAPLIELDDIIGYACPSGPMEAPLYEYLLTTPNKLKEYLKIFTDGVRIGDDDPTHCDPIAVQFRAHVADRSLQSAGELGYLPIGLWLTINLLDHGHNPPANYGSVHYRNNALPSIGYHPVLDYFVVGDPDKGKRGRVNLNTVNAEVMGAVFNRMPLQTELYTHTPAAPGPVISAADASLLSEWLINKGPFERLSELGRFFDETDQLGVKNINAAYNETDPIRALLNSTRARGGFGEFEREALIRNACELLTLRGQTFTIILRADAFAPRFGMTGVKQGNVLATATAVAQVWRDTEPVITQSRDPVNNQLVYTYNYPAFVQFFKILNE